MSDSKDDVIERVEIFVDRLLKGIVEISHLADEYHYGWRRDIARKVHNYQTCSLEEKRDKAISLIADIDELFVRGYVRKGDAFLSNYAWYEIEYKKLKEAYNALQQKHQKLADDYIFIQGKNKQLEELLERMVPKGKDIEP